MRRLPSKLGFRWLSHQIVIEFYHLPVVTHIDKIVGLYNSIGPRPHYPLGGGKSYHSLCSQHTAVETKPTSRVM